MVPQAYLSLHLCYFNYSCVDYFSDHFHSYYCTCLFLPGNSGFTEALHISGMVSVLLSSLADAEGYVRASAVAAVGEAVTASSHQMVLVSNSKLLVRKLLMLHNSSSSNMIFRMVLHFSKVILFMMDGQFILLQNLTTIHCQ